MPPGSNGPVSGRRSRATVRSPHPRIVTAIDGSRSFTSRDREIDMFSFLKRRALLVLLGLALLAVFIWYAGPYFAFADVRPLESANARLIAIAVVVALWALSV